MKNKIFYIPSLLYSFLIPLLLLSCQKSKENFNVVPSNGIFIAPLKSGLPVEVVNITLSSLPSTIDFSVALYKKASDDVKATLKIDPLLVDDYNDKHNSSYEVLPLESVSLSNEAPVIKKETKASDTQQVVINSSLLEEGVNYLLPITIAYAEGGDVELNSLTSTKYFVVTGQLPNIALGKSTRQSTTNGNAESARAVDGNVNGAWSGGSVTHTLEGLEEQWWEIDLNGQSSQISEVKIYNRTDCCSERLSNYYVFVSDKPFTSQSVVETLAQEGVQAFFESEAAGSPSVIKIDRGGRYIRIQLTKGTLPLAIAEVEVLGVL